MARRLILDTGVIVAMERGRLTAMSWLIGDDDISIAAITMAELLVGVELAADPAKRDRRQGFLDALLYLLPIDDYTDATARNHARLLGHVRASGKPRGAHDLIIAATAVTTARTVVTTDASARFDDLPDVAAIVV